MTATCLNTNGMVEVLRICCCASASIVFQGRKTTALSFTRSMPLKVIETGIEGSSLFFSDRTSRCAIRTRNIIDKCHPDARSQQLETYESADDGSRVAYGCFLSACGGAGSSPASDASSAGAQPALHVSSAGTDLGALVTSEEATQALGAAVGPAERPKEANHPPRMATCRYVAPPGNGVA